MLVIIGDLLELFIVYGIKELPETSSLVLSYDVSVELIREVLDLGFCKI